MKPDKAGRRPWARALVLCARLILVALVALLAVACKEEPPKKLTPSSLTAAELRMIRRGVLVVPKGEAEREPFARERLGEGAEVRIAEGGLAWVRRDGGTTMLVRGPGKLVLESEGLRIEGGKVFAETPAGRTETIFVPEGPLVLSAVRASLDVVAGKTDAYVLDGEIRTGATVARAGELLHLGGGKASVEPALSWEDWTGGLATTDPASEPAPYGVGTVGARSPGSAGMPHAPLTIQRLDVRVRVEGDLAITEVDQTFFNPRSETVEGIYRFRVPEGALLERFGVDREGGILYGYVKEKKQAQAQYQSHVYAGSTEDPALLVWSAPGVYEARLYPIQAGATRRVVVRYTEWLARSGASGERRMYVYPMAFDGAESSAPQIEDLSIEVDLSKAGAKGIRSAASAVRVGDVVVVRDHDIVPRSDFALELYDDGAQAARAVRAKHAPDVIALGPEEAKDARRTAGDQADYLLVPVRVTDVPRREEGLDLVVVVDTSAATDRAMLRLARASTRALLAHLGPKDRALVLAGDDRLRAVGKSGELQPVTDALKTEVLEGLARIDSGGASDLAALLSEATTKVGDVRASAIVYVGDGNATVGETDLATIRERMKKAPRLVRTFGLGIGDGANMAMLSGLSTGGFAERVGDDRGAARAALHLLEVAERSVDLGASLDLGDNVERIYPRELGAVVSGETILVVGRVSGESPKQATIKTLRGSAKIDLDARVANDEGDLRRRWAMGRLDELLSEAAGHAALVDLGVRQGIITPVTSIYVPTSTEMTSEQRSSIDRRARMRTKVEKPAEEEKEGAGDGEDLEHGSKSAPSRQSPKAANQRAKGESNKDSDGKADERDDDSPGATGNASASPVAAATASPSAAAPASEPATIAKPMLSPDSAERTPNNEPNDPGRTRSQTEVLDEAQRRITRDPSPPAGGSGGSGLADETKKSVDKFEAKTAPTTTLPPGQLAKQAGDQGFFEQDREATIALREEVAITGNLGDFGGEGRMGGKRGLIIIVDDPGRIVRLCGKGADLPFEQRKNLWRERLSTTNASPHAIAQAYRVALGLCEAPTMRERRAFLVLALDYLPSVASQVAFYRLLTKDAPAADVVYRGILTRVSTPEQVRELNRALGLMTVDPETLEKTIKEAKDPVDRVSKLRLLSSRFPDDRTLLLKLLDALEDAGDAAGARLLATQLRKRSDADARLRTSVGELYLRLASRATEPETKSSDEQEAKRAFGEIVEFSPDDPVARRRLGDLYRAHGYFAEATRQYETLGRLVPDDPTVAMLLAISANGLGKLEEALKWTEKGGQAGAPDVAQGPHATARAFAALFLAWGRMDAKAASKTDEWKALATRFDKIVGAAKREGQVRVLLSWSHPELHPTLWTNALGTMMPASEGDVTLGLTQAMLSERSGNLIEVRIEPAELEHATRLGAKATLTIVFGEAKDGEVVDKREITFTRGAPGTQRFRVEKSAVEAVAIELKPEAKR